MTASAPPAIPGYLSLTEIGRGGFAVVYRARDARFNRDVAIKVLTAGLDDAARARFERECQAAGALSGHPAIVGVYDSGITRGEQLFLVMELLSGGTLASRVAAAPLDAEAAVDLGAAMCGALETAHEFGVLHRDVKPENIMFTGYGAPKLVDFGIATVRGGYETRSASITGSLNHAAPEIISGAIASPASDVYALASTLHQALAGRPAFASEGDETLVPLIARISTAAPPDLRANDVPDALATAIERGMSKDPADRFGSAREFGEALIAAGDPTHRPAMVVIPAAALAAATEAIPELDGADDLAATTSARASNPTPVVPTVPDVVGGGATSVVGRRREPAAAAAAAPVEPPRSRRTVVIAAIATACVVLGSGVAYAVTQHGSPGPSTAAGSSSTPSGSPTLSTPSGSATTSPTIAPSGSTSRPASTKAGSGSGGSGSGGSGSGSVSVGGGTSTANHAPTISAPSSVSDTEQKSISVSVAGHDADGDHLSYSASGLPSGLRISSSSGRITGTISYAAVSLTKDYDSLKSKTFHVVVHVSDGQKSASKAISWKVTDNYILMPNYVGKYGCNGKDNCVESVPNTDALTHHSSDCTKNTSLPSGEIVSQSVRAGTIVPWGVSVFFVYSNPSCSH